MATQVDIEARRERLRQLLQQKGMASLQEICALLNASPSTARRDLEELENLGVLQRTYGGAVCARYPAGQRLAYSDRQTTMLRAKQAIAQAVAALIEEGQTVILDGGTTCYHVAAALAGRRLSVVTNSVPIAALLFSDVACEVTVIGGYLYPRTGVTLGATAERQIEEVRASVLVMSCAGLDAHGIYNVNQMMADSERRMMSAAAKTILAADHSKFGAGALAKVADPGDVDVIVTDDEAGERDLAMLRGLGPRVVVAPVGRRAAG